MSEEARTHSPSSRYPRSTPRRRVAPGHGQCHDGPERPHLRAPTRSQTVESAYQIYQQAVAAKEVAEKTYGRLKQCSTTRAWYRPRSATRRRRPCRWPRLNVSPPRHNGNWPRRARATSSKRAARRRAQAAKEAVKVVKSVLRETVHRSPPTMARYRPSIRRSANWSAWAVPIMSVEMMDDMWGTFTVRERPAREVSRSATHSLPTSLHSTSRSKMRVYAIKDQGSYAVLEGHQDHGPV